MIVTNTGLRIMHKWISNRIVSEYSVSPDWDNNWRTGGSVDEIIDEKPMEYKEAYNKIKADLKEIEIDKETKKIPII